MKSNEMNKTNVTAQDSLGQLCLESCQLLLARIDRVRSAVLAEFRENLQEHEHMLKLALNEAEAVAWQTGVPQLVFPTLAMEKVQAAATWHARQQLVRQHRSPAAVTTG